MPFNLAQIFGGWRRREAKKAPRPADEISRRGRAPERATASKGRDKKISDAGQGAKPKSKSWLAGRFLVSPHVSEKATTLGEERVVFKIARVANKPAIKQAVESRYGVEVKSVNIIAERGKKRRRGAILGIKPGFKKAIVTLKAGNKIAEF